MKIAAIDPGLTGAAVVLEQTGGAVMLISAIDLPIMGDGAKRRLDAFTFARWLNDHAPTHVYIEAGRAMPKTGRNVDVPIRTSMRRDRGRGRRARRPHDAGRAGDILNRRSGGAPGAGLGSGSRNARPIDGFVCQQGTA